MNRRRFLKKNLFGAIVIALSLCAICTLRAGTVRGVEVLEYGRFEKQASAGEYSAKGALTGQVHAVVDAKLVEKTTAIEPLLGTSFGFRVKLVGQPEGLLVSYTAKCIHPRITNPTTGRSSEVEKWTNYGIIGRGGYVGYTFDNSYEAVPGAWTIQIFVGSKLMAEKTFNVSAASGN